MTQENPVGTISVLPQTNEHSLRIEFIFKPTSKSKFLLSRHKYPIQNNPFKYGIKITNIGSKPFPGCAIIKADITFNADSLIHNSETEANVRALNCGESTDIYMDSVVISSKGTGFISVEMKPIGTDIIKTYQYDEFHKKDNLLQKNNCWLSPIFLQGELEILQQRTNELILALTIITVYESVIGLKTTLSYMAALAGHFFLFLGQSLISAQ